MPLHTLVVNRFDSAGRRVVKAPHDTSTLTDHSRIPEYPAWSERERRWVVLTFDEHRAWLARPDLDPVVFASRELAS